MEATKPSLWLRLGLPIALVAAAAMGAHAYDTSWIASGQPVSAMSMKTALDEVQTRLVALESVSSTRVYRTSAQSIPGGADTIVSFDSIRFDYGTQWTSGNPTRLTASVAGVYLVGACGAWLFNGNGSREVAVLVNGSTQIQSQLLGPATNTPEMCVSSVYQLAANDYVEMKVYQSSGGALNLTGAEFWLHRLH